ncbi:MAG TPA: hypothetical protein VKC66_16415 [Xanthobacteraceae bacterium]|nr:hypothetical protein [Xanthobacteraceae bacterium]
MVKDRYVPAAITEGVIFRHLLSNAGNLFRAGRDEIYQLLRIELPKNRKGCSNGGGRSVKLALGQL